MPVTFERANKDVTTAMERVMRDHHPVLQACGVTVDVLMTQDVDENGVVSATLKHNGYSAVAVIKATSLKERVLGIADALMIIDSVTFDALTEKEKLAVLDHELTHLIVKSVEGDDLGLTDKGALSGVPKSDDHGRPKLEMRLHDWQLGGFKDVAQRHGKNAIEVQAVRGCVDSAGQYFWDWDKPRKVA